MKSGSLIRILKTAKAISLLQMSEGETVKLSGPGNNSLQDK